MSKILITLTFIILITCFSPYARGETAAIVLHTRDAVAWLPQQTIHGSLIDFNVKTVVIHQDERTFTIAVQNDGSFNFPLTLHDDSNRIWAEAAYKDAVVVSDTVHLQLGYHPLPVVKPYATVVEDTVVLHAATISTPWKEWQYYWVADNRNPAPVTISNAKDSVIPVQIPVANGIYYFHVATISGDDTAWFQTYITRSAQKLQAFNMDTAHAAWIDNAVIYEITPYAFVKGATYDDITTKLPEIKSLGVNTIWLQPVFKSYDKGQGYSVTDYFSLRDDLGSEAQLQRLVQTAKSLNLRVIFDFVPNHTSIYHPYAQDCAIYKEKSHYYDFYQHTDDGVMYSSQYHKDDQGFIYYFWKDLVNLNYSNAEVQQWIVEACKYWVKKLDIDGYRFDAVWGVNARQPDFAKRLRLELKVIKPELLLLAEDKGAMTATYTKGFDAAFDWTADTGWVSKWSWQYDYNPQNNLLIFSFPHVKKRGHLLRKALFHNGDSTHLRLRYTENNDLPRFIASQQLERTKMAAALTFALPGIPLIYNGQEAGIATTPSRTHPTFEADQSIQSLDKDSLFPFYQKLIAIRQAHDCLRNQHIRSITLSPAAAMTAFYRWNEKEDIIAVINMDASGTDALLNLHTVLKKSTGRLTLTDLMTGEVFKYPNVKLTNVRLPMNGYSTRILAVDTL